MRRVSAAVLLLCTTACGGTRLTLPQGAGAAAPDAPSAWLAATRRCQSVETLSAEVRVRGRVSGRRIRATLLVGAALPRWLYVDVPAPFGPSAIILGAAPDGATLLMPRDKRFLDHVATADVLEAMTGVFIGAEDLRGVLTGCPAGAPPVAGRAIGDAWRVFEGDGRQFLRRDAANRWRLVAIESGEGVRAWRAEFDDFRDDLPRSVRLVSVSSGRFDVTLSVSHVDVNAGLDPATFRVSVPAGYRPITLDDLRSIGPLQEGGA